jgi:NAD(P)-dependent dehydrogenase (short-subunit alcohol dehydrogenase family)
MMSSPPPCPEAAAAEGKAAPGGFWPGPLPVGPRKVLSGGNKVAAHAPIILMTKTILITGASSGIGRATAQLFAEKGWNVVATMREPAAGRDLAGLERVMVARLDVQDRGSIAESIRAGVERFGRIDLVVNNAGYGQYGLFESIPREKVIEQFEVNVFGVMDVTRAILPHFRKNRSGMIIQVSSGAGLFTLPMISLYCASKFALEGFSESLAFELSSQNITVKLVEPHGGVTRTAFNERSAKDNAPVGELRDYDDFARRTGESFARMSAARTTSSDDVAQVIHLAATDGTDRLRYLVGDDARGFIRAWDTLSNEDYVSFMRSLFSPTA